MTGKGNGNNQRGSGALSVEQQEEALTLLYGGLSQRQAGAHFGVSKNVIAGIWARSGNTSDGRAPTTVFDRLSALHTRMDAVLAVTVGVGRIKEPEQKPRPSFGSLF